MIQFREDEVCRMMKAIAYYRNEMTGSDEMWDRYDSLLKKLHEYGEEVSPIPVMCDEE